MDSLQPTTRGVLEHQAEHSATVTCGLCDASEVLQWEDESISPTFSAATVVLSLGWDGSNSFGWVCPVHLPMAQAHDREREKTHALFKALDQVEDALFQRLPEMERRARENGWMPSHTLVCRCGLPTVWTGRLYADSPSGAAARAVYECAHGHTMFESVFLGFSADVWLTPLGPTA